MDKQINDWINQEKNNVESLLERLVNLPSGSHDTNNIEQCASHVKSMFNHLKHTNR